MAEKTGQTNLTAYPPPAGLSERAQAYWKEIMNAVAFGFFSAADLPLLRNYCKTLALIDAIFDEIGSDGEREEFVLQTERGAYQANPIYSVLNTHQHLAAQLAVRLRLTPKSRYEESPEEREKGEKSAVGSGGRGARDGLFGLQGYVDEQRKEGSQAKPGKRTRH